MIISGCCVDKSPLHRLSAAADLFTAAAVTREGIRSRGGGDYTEPLHSQPAAQQEKERAGTYSEGKSI